MYIKLTYLQGIINIKKENTRNCNMKINTRDYKYKKGKHEVF